MTTCRCTATKHATAHLHCLDSDKLDEIGWGTTFNQVRFNRYMDAFRMIFYLRRGLALSGYTDLAALHANELSAALDWEKFSTLSDVEAALVLYRSRSARPTT